NGEPIQVFNNGDLYRDFTYIDDIIEGIMNIIPNPPKPDEDGVRHKIYNIGNNHPVKLIDFIHTLEEVIGKKAIIEYKPMQPGDVYTTYADVDDLVRDFNFKPNTSLKDGLTKFVEWYKDYYNIKNF
nr:NAD-dependent epimerase/dehydratase family protein [Bacillota bacterium]